MNILFSRTSSLLSKYAAKGKKPPWYRGQVEGLYSMKPKFHGGAKLPGGHTYQTIPQTAVGYAKRPLQSLRKSWEAIGPKREITGLKTRGWKLPEVIRSPKGKTPSRLSPSFQRIMLLGQAAESARAAVKGKPENRGMHIGRGIGGTLGWLASSRMKMLPSMVTWGAGEALGGALGKVLTRKKAAK